MKKTISLLCGLILFATACKKKDNNTSVDNATVPSVQSVSVVSITANGAVGIGNTTSDGNSGVLENGFVYATTPNPENSAVNYEVVTGAGTGTFYANLTTGIVPGTTYYAKAWSRNAKGKSYGNELSFTTLTVSIPSVNTVSVTNITYNSAICSGNIVSDGNNYLIQSGFCYSSANALPTTADIVINAGSGIGSYSTTLNSLNSNTVYYLRAFATNSVGTSYGGVITFTTNPGVGDSFQGGIIAYILQSGDPGYDSNIQHGIIAAPSDQSASAPWALTLTNTGATAQALGAGQNNTNLIVGNQGAGTYAAQLCDNLSLGGYNDWYLPSLDELKKLYLNKAVIGGFSVAFYWSSSEDTQNTAWLQSFNSNSQSPGIKTNNNYVRAVRSF